jgi:hypothetical protein
VLVRGIGLVHHHRCETSPLSARPAQPLAQRLARRPAPRAASSIRRRIASVPDAHPSRRLQLPRPHARPDPVAAVMASLIRRCPQHSRLHFHLAVRILFRPIRRQPADQTKPGCLSRGARTNHSEDRVLQLLAQPIDAGESGSSAPALYRNGIRCAPRQKSAPATKQAVPAPSSPVPICMTTVAQSGRAECAHGNQVTTFQRPPRSLDIASARRGGGVPYRSIYK